MKKVLFLLILFYPAILYSQPASGNGSSGNPYSGVITTPWTLSGDKYCGNLTVSNGTFTISGGATLRFGTGNSLTITGTGVLSANGSVGNRITFTSSGSSWGHIFFDNRNGTSNSSLNYCIIENGNATSLSPAYGGAILINTNGVSLSNSIFRNNSAGWGGGIFLDKFSNNNTLMNCSVTGNYSSNEGGGIYIWANTYATISNCLVNNNTARGTGGGFFIGEDALDIAVINSTIVNNSATNGYNLEIALNNNVTYKPHFLNCIVWGASNSIEYYGQTPQSSDFTYCAIQNPVTGSTTNCITLNSANINTTGPNFNDPSAFDYTITVVSPCRDGGTNTGAPSTDYAGNSRIGTTDIGAYENIYTKWTGNSSIAWDVAANWDNGVPGTSLDALITNSSLNPLVSNNDVSISNLSIESGGVLTIGSSKLLTISRFRNNGSIDFQPGTKGTITTIFNNGTFKLEADASSISSLIFSNFSGSDITHEIYLSGGEFGGSGSKAFKWHYISTPTTTLSTSIFTAKTLNIAQFVENRPTTGLSQGWVASDGYIYSTDAMGGPTFSSLSPGAGYNYYYSSDWEYTFSGQPNSGSTPTSVTLKYSGTNDLLYGYNLVGNPYPSGIDWDFITANGYPSNTSKALYLTSNNSLITYSNGVSSPEGYSTGIIPPMQGFFIKTYFNNTSFTIPLGSRTHNNIHARYKGSSIGSTSIPLIRLSTSENGTTDETVIRFDETANISLDYDFDALKLFASSTNTQIFSSLSGINYAINGQPFPETLVEIPLVVNFLTTGVHSISAIQIQGLEKYNIKLKDLFTGQNTDLKTAPIVSFSSEKGTQSNRFILTISNISTGTEVISVDVPKPFVLYSTSGSINIQPISDDWDRKTGTIRVIDFTGRCLLEEKNIQFFKSETILIPSPLKLGLYMVEICSGSERYVGKIITR